MSLKEKEAMWLAGFVSGMTDRKADYQDVLKNLPAGDAKRDGLIFVIADLEKRIGRLGGSDER